MAVAFLAGVFFAVVVFTGAFFATVALAGVFAAAFGAVLAAVAVSARGAPAASVRAVFETAARALPAAVWAPFALFALPSAMRLLAALAAYAFDVVLTTRPDVWTAAPPVAALNLRVSRDLRRAAAFGWIAPTLAARSRAAWASASARAAVSASESAGATLSAVAT